MSKHGLKKMALLLLIWVAMESCRLNAQTITGNVVTNNLTVTGDTITIGSQTGTTNPGWGAIYTDGTNSTVEFQGTRSGNTWEWQQSDGSILQMTLDTTNTLKLYNSSGTAEITLNPTGTSSFSGSVTVNGTDNEMPNQTLVNGNSVLTESLGDGRYASSSAITISGSATSLGGGTASADYSFAEGSGSTALGYGSTALGYGSTASGWASTAMGNSTASGHYSTASGYRSTASGYYSTASGYVTRAIGQASTASGWYSFARGIVSTALGNFSTASGNYSIAMGDNATASGSYSTAMGSATTAQAFGSVVIGQANTGLNANGTTPASATTWVPTDPLFEVGNGTTSLNYYTTYYTWFGHYMPVPATTSDAFVVYKNGNAAVQGTLATGSTITAPAVVLTTGSGDIPMFTGTN